MGKQLSIRNREHISRSREVNVFRTFMVFEQFWGLEIQLQKRGGLKPGLGTLDITQKSLDRAG